MHQKQTLDDYLRYLVLRYCSLILAVALVIGVLENLMAMSGWQRSSSGSNFLTMILPAIDTGLVFARRFGHKLEKDEAWLLSGVLTIVATVISFGIVDVLDLLSCGNVVAQIQAIGMMLFTTILIVIMAICLVVTRYALGFGAYLELKRRVKLSEKER